MAVVIGAVSVVGVALMNANARSAMQESMNRVAGFQPSQHFMSCDARTGIGIDQASRQACLMIAGAIPRIVPFHDLLQIEVLEDGHTITKTERGSQAGRALVGGLLLGPVGLLAGALTAKTRSVGKVRRVDLRILINDPTSPSHSVNFLAHEVTITSLEYNKARKQADHWHAALTACINQADADDTQIEGTSPATHSVANELSKLADLHARGILTAEEFAEQKALTLGRR
jgi:hypothetical protein